MLIKRSLANKISNLKKSLLLLGPRQTGKSTLIQELNPDLEINLADQESFVRHLSDPGLIKNEVKKYKKIFVDEVQRIPSLLNTIQVLIDKDKSKQFLLTGSSARKLRQGKANLLPGRIVHFELGPLTISELGEQFDVARALQLGLLPGIYLEEDTELAKKTLRSYAATYLKEEIQAESLTRNLEGFSRFFQIVASRSGDHIDFTKMASQSMIERTSAKRYYDILIDTLVVQEVPAFTRSQRRRLIQHPRFYFFDTGVLNGCLENFQVSQDRLGSLFEHLFVQLLTSAAKGQDHTIKVSNYRTEAGAEVDFVFERGSEVYAIEVKATKNIGPTDLRGLKSFSEFYGKKHTPLIVYLGERELEIDKVLVLPISEAMKTLGYG